MRLRFFFALGLMLLAAPAGAAEVFTYDTPGEKIGAALVATAARREIVRRTTEYCGDKYPAIKAESQEAFVAWVGRQRGFLMVAEGLRDQMRKTSDPEKAAQWKQILDIYIPKQIDGVAAATLQSIADMPIDEMRRKMCADFVAKARSGGLDLDKWEPGIAASLRELAGKSASEPAGSPPPEVKPDPKARRDAAAIIGHWKNERQTFYRFDGGSQSLVAPCTVDLTRERMTSLCEDGRGGTVRSVHSFKIPAPGIFETIMIENSAQPQSVGTRGRSSFRVEGERFS